ncbi:DUF4012 domain-containing protein, partial [Candidatus Beckwithbacteria bacterium]|nr:DUF4012 domain-containing protein [Candidatus Beckwithbacteria bacterium]
EKIVPQLDAVTAKLSVANEELKKIDPNDYPEQIKGKEVRARILQAESLVSDATLALTDAKPIIEVLPELLGYPNFKQYLVIFQNDGEQRPTGGFMSAFAVLKADKGKITAEKSGDIYSLDDKFGRNVAAPEIIQKYLDEKSWHLRNMNLSPDFRVSMTTFKDAYDGLQGETEVSGVIAINTHVLEELIKVIGPVTVEGYGTFTTELDARCNLSQVICELEHMIDKPLATMVSNRKSTVLGPLMQQIMKQAMGGGKEQMASLFTLAMDLVKQKHVLAYFDDEKEQKANEIFNMAGRIKDFDGDYLHINNANFGGAKSNFYITQEVEQEIQIAADGTVTKKLYISYSHNQPMDNCNLEDGDLCLSGIQRNYFRVYVPKGSVLTEGLGSEVEIDTGEDLGKTYFDGFFELRPESKAKVMLVYTLPFKVSNGQAYKMMIQKQAGEKEISYKVNLNGKEENFIVNEDLEKSWQVN